MSTNTNTSTEIQGVDQFLSALKQQIQLTCRIHHCNFKDIPEPLWRFTLDAACSQEHIDFKRNVKRTQSV